MKSSIQGKRVAVFGSIDPYFECVALYFGAESVTTFEYNQLSFEHDKLHVVTSDRYRTLIAAVEQSDLSHPDYAHYSHYFDFAFSFSSFDHSGLGRYGDPLDPYGDLQAMTVARKLLKGGGMGKLMLSLPIGPDVTVWNLHRRYGIIRVPMVLEAFFHGAKAAIERTKRKDSMMEMKVEGDGSLEGNELFYQHPIVKQYWPEIVRAGWYQFKLTQAAPFSQTYEPILIFSTQ